MSDLPFPAVINQEDLKRALLLNAVNRSIGGVLIRGEKGTGKSSTVRGLKRLLPEQRVVKDCVFNCHPDRPRMQCEDCREATDHEEERIETPVVELPLGATEDRVVGSLDIEQALNEGVSALEPGLLARANRGILYIDEVNLLDDHLVDVLLDVAASGTNRVEREGVSVEHPAEFILVGTMNPDEGRLRPQFLDRFGLQVDTATPDDPNERVAIIDISETFDRNPEAVVERYAAEEQRLRERIETARQTYDDLELRPSLKRRIARLCIDMGIEGNRGDVITSRCARTITALDGRTEVSAADVSAAARLALPHRIGRRPFDDTGDFEDAIQEHFGDGTDDTEDPPDPESNEEESANGSKRRSGGSEDRKESAETSFGDTFERVWRGFFGVDEDDEDDGNVEHETDPERRSDGSGNDGDSNGTERRYLDPISPGEPTEGIPEESPTEYEVGTFDLERFDEQYEDAPGDKNPSPSGDRGKYVTARQLGEVPERTDIAVDASLRSAARRGRTEITEGDMWWKVRRRTSPALVVFAIDSSASMRAHGHITAAREIMTSLFEDVYRKHDSVAVVAFRDETAEVVVPPTNDIHLAEYRLDQLPVGNKTPLSHGLATSMTMIEQERTSNPETIPFLIVVTDGRPTVAVEADPLEEVTKLSERAGAAGINLVVLDMDTGIAGADVCEKMAARADGEYIPLHQRPQDTVHETIRKTIDRSKSGT